MKKQIERAGGKPSALVKVLYVISAILMCICVYMIVVNVLYIRDYASMYGVAVSDMISDAAQYVITGSVAYFVYGVLIFCAARILRILQGKKPEPEHDAPEHDAPEHEITEDDIPESEDAVEKTEVIEDEK